MSCRVALAFMSSVNPNDPAPRSGSSMPIATLKIIRKLITVKYL